LIRIFVRSVYRNIVAIHCFFMNISIFTSMSPAVPAGCIPNSG
jgi:hypothetical protein